MPRSRTGVICLGLAVLTLALYLPALRHDFLTYDDQQYVTENALVRAGLTAQGWVWAFGNHAGNWHPLALLSHMLDCQLYGLRPWGHHLTNLLLHVANTVLLFLLLNRLTKAVWPSALVAALFGWHPLHVESVAWVAERKDVLSASFFFLTLLAYTRYAARKEDRGLKMEQSEKGRVPSSLLPPPSSTQPRRALWYGLALFLFALGLLSKPMVVTLPFVLLLLDFWPLRRLELRSKQAECRSQNQPAPSAKPSHFNIHPSSFIILLEKLPFLLLTAFACALTLSAQQPAMASTAGLGITARLEHTLLAYAHYLGALFLPRHLAIYYPYEKVVPAAQLVLALLVVAGLTGLALRWTARRPYLLMGWLWFLGTLVPVIGLVQVGDQAWADRYTYLPSIGLFVALVWGLAELAAAHTVVRRALPWVAAAASVALLAGTSVQLRYWKDTRTLFAHTAQVTRHNPLATTLLGSLLAQEGKFDEAIRYYRTALSYTPGFPEAHFFLGHALDQQGHLDQAIAEYQQALWYKPIQEQVHLFLGSALAKQQKPEPANAHYLAALQLNPQSAVAHNNLAKLLHAQGQLEEAIVHYSAALRFDPALAQAHNNLGVLLLQKGQTAEGIAQLREALRLKPGDPESELNLAQGLLEQQQWSEAAGLFAKYATATTRDPQVHYRLAVALVHLGRTREAVTQYANALLLQPDFPAALDGLAWILATSPNAQLRNADQAYAMAERACELTARKDPEKLKTLAAACAESERYSQAVLEAQAAHDLALKAGRTNLADECRRLRERFKAAQPWREAL
jgi:protein O-mannosyl-transferase